MSHWFFAANVAAVIAAARYSAVVVSQKVTTSTNRSCKCATEVTAIAVASNTFIKTQRTGIKCRIEEGSRCLRITATFQYPYWKYWWNKLDKFERGEYQDTMEGSCQILPPERRNLKFSSSS